MKVSNLPERTKHRVCRAGEKPQDVETVTRSCLVTELFLKISQNPQEDTSVLESLFNKLGTFLKRDKYFPVNFATF